MILFTFALVFITVYLYYVITDIRKLQSEVKKIHEETESRKQQHAKEIESLTTAIVQLSKDAKPLKQSTVTECADVAPVCNMPQVKEIPVVAKTESVAKSVTSESIVIDDNESVMTEDIRETLNCDSDDEGVDISSVLEPSPETHSDTSLPSVEDIQSLKYEELKELCKTHNLSTKGNKEAIMNRVRDFVLSKGL